MNKKIVLIILVILSLTVSILGCIGDNPEDDPYFVSPEKNTFNEEGVYFEYPSNWEDLPKEDSENPLTFVVGKGNENADDIVETLKFS